MRRKNEVVILMVEDDVVDQQAMARAFKKLKITNQLVFANDGLEALEMLRSEKGMAVERPYLIILDLNMPRMNGHEFLREIRNDPKLNDAVIFVLTTSKNEEDRIAAYNQNVAGYVSKGDFSGSFMKAVDMLKHYWSLVDLPE